MSRAFLAPLVAVLGTVACASEASAPPPAPPPRPRFSDFSLAASATTTPPAASGRADAGTLVDEYTFDVWVVEQPPSAVYFLARFSEPPGQTCEASLLAYARGLGANRLYVERDAPCTGSAYFVRGAAQREDRGSPHLRAASVENDEPVVAWLRARWKRPASISPEASRRMCVVVQFTVSPMRRVWDVPRQPLRSSGNPEFDASVRAALESAIDEHADVPRPPRELVGENVVYRVEFTEGDPRVCRGGVTRGR